MILICIVYEPLEKCQISTLVLAAGTFAARGGIARVQRMRKYLLATFAWHIPVKMFRIASRASSTSLRRQCVRRYATVSETIPDGPPVTATNRECVQNRSKPDLYLLKVLRQPKGGSGRLSVSRKMMVH